MISSIKKLIPFNLKASTHLMIFSFKPLKAFSFEQPRAASKRVFIFLAADYGNLGDVAITHAQHKFLQNNFPEYLVTEIPISQTIEGIAFVKKIIAKDDIVTTVGGGNMGDLYPMIEHFRQMVISNFRHNMVISFPQTIDFSETIEGKKALNRAIRVYSKHKNLILLAREQKTYKFFTQHFKNNQSVLVPDIVLSLDKTIPSKERNGVIICLRNDKEKKLNQQEEEILFEIIDKSFDKKTTRDTHIGGKNLSLFSRTKALFSIWEDFKGAEVVITDRLHGMIFCFITNTPAIVFLNNNHKIKSSFEWIKKSKRILLIEKFSKDIITKSIKTLKEQDNSEKKENLLPRYHEAINIIKEKK